MTQSTQASIPITRARAIEQLTAAGQPFELETLSVRGQAQRVFKNAPRSLRELYAVNTSDQTFLVFDSERLTFAQAYQMACAIADILIRDYGVAKGDRVAISMRNYPEWVLAFTAVTSIGAVAVAMNALWQPEEMEYGLRDCAAKVLFADQERLERLAQCPPGTVAHVIGVRTTRVFAGVANLQGLVARRGEVAMPQRYVEPEDTATIFYTSGSTGHPKGVISTHRGVLSALFSWELDAQVSILISGVEPPLPPYQTATLLAVPLFHVTGSHAVYLMCYRAQRKLVCMYKWDVEQAATLIEREQIGSFIAPPAMTGDLVRAARRTQRDLTSLLAIGGGGAPRAPEQVLRIESEFAQALPVTGWGMTETNAIGVGIGGADYLAHPASSGRCSAVMEVCVVDEKGNPLPSGERGELLVRGTAMFVGYWNRPQINATLFDDGWFHTGDVAYLAEEGYLFIVDRIKDLIIRGGENIGCGQVEAVLLAHPDVYEAVVYAVPDERLGEEVGATVHGAARLDLEALRTYLGQHLARFEIPRYMRYAPAPLPRTASGKLHKRQIQAAAIAEHKARAAPRAR